MSVSSAVADSVGVTPGGWGRQRVRFALALGMLFAGGLIVQTTSVFALWLMLLGAVVHAAGWVIVPGRGWRRSVAVVPSVVTMVLILNGASAMAALAMPLAAWLLVRQRAPLAYLVLGVPILTASVLAQFLAQYGQGAVVLLIAGITLIGSAWIASLRWFDRPFSGKPPAIIR
jgi:hypothetical protein